MRPPVNEAALDEAVREQVSLINYLRAIRGNGNRVLGGMVWADYQRIITAYHRIVADRAAKQAEHDARALAEVARLNAETDRKAKAKADGMAREPGYYWVFEYEGSTIAEWSGSEWLFCGDGNRYPAEFSAPISGRIERPTARMGTLDLLAVHHDEA